MRYSYKKWKKELMEKDVKAMLILSFPAIQLLDISVKELISDSNIQAKAMLEIASMLPKQEALVSMMDLSLEAEAFGCEIECNDNEVPTVKGVLLKNRKDAELLQVPDINNGRCSIYLNAIEKVVKEETKRPVFAGVIGPFSLAGRLMDVSEIMIQCLMDPDYANIVLRKATQFLKKYINAYKEVGANGVIIAEPLAGLLSPEMLAQFSSNYIREITDELQNDKFSIIYHNCGPNTVQSIDEIISTNCAAYHFGNAIHLKDILDKVETDTLIMGNIDPVKYFRNGTIDEMKKEMSELLDECGLHTNFIASSGCDIPPLAKWENIKQFYKSIEYYNQKRGESYDS